MTSPAMTLHPLRLGACRRLLKDTGTLWVIGSTTTSTASERSYGPGYWIFNDIVWVKTNPMPNFRGVRFTNAHETLMWAQKGKAPLHLQSPRHEGTQRRQADAQRLGLPTCTGNERVR